MPDGPHATDSSSTGVSCRYGCLVAADAGSLARRASKRGIDRADLERLVAVTEGICMVCRACHATVVEHCHNTGRVRGIACADCNARIGRLEGSAYWPPSYVGGCACARRRTDGELLRWMWQLEQATYRFLDHAMEPGTHDRKAAFAWLADHPYPAGDSSAPADPTRLPPARTRRHARETERMLYDLAEVAHRQRQRGVSEPPDDHWNRKARARIAVEVRAAYGWSS